MLHQLKRIEQTNMITCAHKDCGYQVGWTHYGSDENKYLEPPEGDFYNIRAEFKTVTAERYHGDNNEMRLLGCPKCCRTFITNKKEDYLTTLSTTQKD